MEDTSKLPTAQVTPSEKPCHRFKKPPRKALSAPLGPASLDALALLLLPALSEAPWLKEEEFQKKEWVGAVVLGDEVPQALAGAQVQW